MIHPEKFRYHRFRLPKSLSLKLQIFSYPSCLTFVFGCSKEFSYQGSSFEYPQHMFWLIEKKINYTLLSEGLDFNKILFQPVCLLLKQFFCKYKKVTVKSHPHY